MIVAAVVAVVTNSIEALVSALVDAARMVREEYGRADWDRHDQYCQQFIQTFVSYVEAKGWTFVYHTSNYDYDRDCQGEPFAIKISIQEVSSAIFNRRYITEMIEEAAELINSNSMNESWITEAFNNDNERGYLYTSKSWEEKVEREEEAELEDIAKSIAGKDCIGTFGFLDKIEEMISKEDGRIEGLNEDGLCACSTMGYRAVDEWYEMTNNCRERQSQLIRLQNWFQRRCPLIWAKWQEEKLSATL